MLRMNGIIAKKGDVSPQSKFGGPCETFFGQTGQYVGGAAFSGAAFVCGRHKADKQTTTARSCTAVHFVDYCTTYSIQE